MAADAYLKVAAGQLQQAATEVKREADVARAEATNFKQKVSGDIVSMKARLNAKEYERDRRRDEPHAYATLNLQVQQIQKEIQEKQQEMDQKVSEAEQIARGKEGAMQGLKSQASQLQQQSADPNLR
ncbi:MAG TPA: hypothetical protein VF572_04275 [Candidatus Saccharimonadales bacterium]|jgi:hypothetical protein